MCKFIGKSNERIFCKLSQSEILRLYSIVHVAMETTKTSNFTCQSKSFISIFFTRQVSACELQPFSRHDLANDIYSETAKTVFSHLNVVLFFSLPWAFCICFSACMCVASIMGVRIPNNDRGVPLFLRASRFSSLGKFMLLFLSPKEDKCYCFFVLDNVILFTSIILMAIACLAIEQMKFSSNNC